MDVVIIHPYFEGVDELQVVRTVLGISAGEWQFAQVSIEDETNLALMFYDDPLAIYPRYALVKGGVGLIMTDDYLVTIGDDLDGWRVGIWCLA
jgi:hypothetical protein